MPPSEWKGTQLVAAHPRRHIMPLSAEPPGLQVLQDLPRIGTALPVIMDPAAVPRTGLPQVGDWVKIKVVGVAAVQVSHAIPVCSQHGKTHMCALSALACVAVALSNRMQGSRW
jgi:hypothetical protein